MSKWVSRGIHIAITMLLLVMAVIQLNDPDPLYWVTVYSLVALTPALRIFHRSYNWLLNLTLGMVLAGLLMSAPGFIDYVHSRDFGSITGKMMAEKAYVEYAREFLGLVIAITCLAIYRYRQPQADRDSMS